MSDTTMEKKLELVQQIRSQYNKNQYDLFHREQILYGRTSQENYRNQIKGDSFTMPYPEENTDDLNDGVSFFKVRLLLAAVLLGGIILLDLSGGDIAGITTGQIFDAISEDYEEDIDGWLGDITDSPAPL